MKLTNGLNGDLKPEHKNTTNRTTIGPKTDINSRGFILGFKMASAGSYASGWFARPLGVISRLCFVIEVMFVIVSFSSVHPSVHIFKRLLLYFRPTNSYQISFGVSLGWGERKIAKMSADREDTHLLLQK